MRDTDEKSFVWRVIEKNRLEYMAWHLHDTKRDEMVHMIEKTQKEWVEGWKWA